MGDDGPGIRRLFLFDAVCGAASIGQAAAAVGLSQPALSQAIAKLEDRFGAVLFERGHNGSDLTAEGGILHRRVRRMLGQIEQAVIGLPCDPSPDQVSRICRTLTDSQIRCHIAIAQGGSAAEAARRLGISQPAVHRAARELEQTVRMPLYRRRIHGVSVNPAGMEFARRLNLALREIAQAFEDLAAARGETSGRVAVGVLPLVPQRWLARIIGSLLRVHPGAAITLREGSHQALIGDLLFGAIDFMVGALREPRLSGAVVETELFPDPYAVVVRRGHALASLPAITGHDLASYDWVVPHKNMPRRVAIDAMLATLPVQPRLVVETSSLAMMTAMLAESDCVTLLSRSQILQEDWGKDMVALAVEVPSGRRTVGLTTRQDWLATPLQQTFVSLLRQQANIEGSEP